MGDRFGKNKTKAQSGKKARSVDNMPTRDVAEDLKKVVFSFKYLDFSQCPPGQTFNEWQSEGLLDDFAKVLSEISDKTIDAAKADKSIELYGEFPSLSDFKVPDKLDPNLNWGTIRKIGGQKPRVAGFFRDNIFYVVFMDMEHKFSKSTKTNKTKK